MRVNACQLKTELGMTAWKQVLVSLCDSAALTCLNSSSSSGLKCQSTTARAETSSRLLQEMQPSRNPSPATASVMESTSAQPPRHSHTAVRRRRRGGREWKRERGRWGKRRNKAGGIKNCWKNQIRWQLFLLIHLTWQNANWLISVFNNRAVQVIVYSS